ncbi:MAG: type II toxin-antitoxin system RelE/ParE family toxin [Azospirillaceae bacterium]|nr:type II toxin-antitoxin system RelE/ParE family toxin [Azospirillaceae bacterium]
MRPPAAHRVVDYRISGPAQAEIDQILDWSWDHFGDLAMRRYFALIRTAIMDVASDPHRISVRWVSLSNSELGLYHLGHSRAHVSHPPGAVQDPRHILVFRIGVDDVVEILGLVHDRMLLGKALDRIWQANQA